MMSKLPYIDVVPRPLARSEQRLLEPTPRAVQALGGGNADPAAVVRAGGRVGVRVPRASSAVGVVVGRQLGPHVEQRVRPVEHRRGLVAGAEALPMFLKPGPYIKV